MPLIRLRGTNELRQSCWTPKNQRCEYVVDGAHFDCITRLGTSPVRLDGVNAEPANANLTEDITVLCLVTSGYEGG